MKKNINWDEVFRLRCRSKTGQTLTPEEHALCQAAYKADPERYRATEKDVFNATVPFGSNVRLK